MIGVGVIVGVKVIVRVGVIVGVKVIVRDGVIVGVKVIVRDGDIVGVKVFVRVSVQVRVGPATPPMTIAASVVAIGLLRPPTP
jgi:hypothetical protein